MDEFQQRLERVADRLRLYRLLWIATTAWCDHSSRGVYHLTPAEIAKLTDQAIRGKALMAKSSKSAVRATTVFDNFEATLARFDAGVDGVDQQEKALAAQLTAMGNAGPILDATFQDDKAAKTPVPPPVNGSSGGAPVTSPLATSS